MRLTPASTTNRDLDQGIVGGASPLRRRFVCVFAFSDAAVSSVPSLFPTLCKHVFSLAVLEHGQFWDTGARMSK